MKKILALLLAVLMLVLSAPVAFAAEESGVFRVDGDKTDTYWSYNSNTKTLKVSGKVVNSGEHSAGFIGEDGNYIMMYWHEGHEPSWYKYRNEAEKLIVEEGVEEIEENAFSRFSSLKYVSLPESLISIESGAFYACKSLNTITTDKSKKMKEGVLCLPDSLIYMEDCIGINALVEVESLPKNLRTIRESFYGTKFYLNDQNWENGLLYIGEYLVSSKKDLSGVVEIKEGTRIVSGGCFKENKKIEEVIVPKTVERICSSTFYGCENLKKLTVYNYKMNVGDEYYSEGATANTVETDFLPEQTIIKCYKYSKIYEYNIFKFYQFEFMGKSPDATFAEKIKYFFWDIIGFFGIDYRNL